MLGPLIGGQLVDTASWRWIFAINIPIVLLTLFIVFRAVPEGRARRTRASTWWGQRCARSGSRG